MRDIRQAIIVSLALMLAPASTLAGDVTVKVGHGSFEPSEVAIEAGDTVTFTNTQEMPGGHTVVFDELDVRSKGLAKGESWSHTFEKAGTYRFRVEEHPDNAGSVAVE